jgi:hypothetical protein
VPDDGGAGGGGEPEFQAEALISTYENPEVPPEGVEFIGPEFSCLPGLPCGEVAAQFELIDDGTEGLEEGSAALRATGKLKKDESLNANDDYNACGQLSLTAILHILGRDDLSAIEVYNQVAVNSANDVNFIFDYTDDQKNGKFMGTYYKHLWPTAEEYGLSRLNLNPETWINDFSAPGNKMRLDTLYALMIEPLENGQPLLALVNIARDGIVVKGALGINPWLVVTGIGNNESGRAYVRVWNPFSNRAEYYDLEYFRDSFVFGTTTLATFSA